MEKSRVFCRSLVFQIKRWVSREEDGFLQEETGFQSRRHNKKTRRVSREFGRLLAEEKGA